MGLGGVGHLRVLNPEPGLYAYYDGRVPGYRFMAAPNWVDEGAISLGTASYALVAGAEALVYDTHVSLAHAGAIRAHLEGLGVRHFTVIYSHWHLDHVAGTAAFDGAPVIANHLTLSHLTARRDAIEAATYHGAPAINPLILPTETFDNRMAFDFGGERVELIAANIHSDDAALLWLPDRGTLLAGDTVEDTVTYVGAPEDFAIHLRDLDRIGALGARHIYPNHGAPERIATEGYGGDLLAATARYVSWLQSLAQHPYQGARDLAEVVKQDLNAGTLIYWPEYEAVHRQNVEQSLAHFAGKG
ncbi:MBL fold metallo-hydrolase [Frigidibacter sp. RF13]|uniref:MBL fold metallo-hydrolase n=1 Tax=Frigidibacter sp. RF13 TaxID=2997340 RepID=UPI00226FE3F3|nr:MBL fold metallo-hydrolase [Frigidibacter sp. RF13]MCY1126065.1 MBL fold metallo-hydrolase [Frigidibacter sp. RF13]